MSVHLCTFLSVLSVFVQYLYIFLLSLLCWMVYCLYWVFVCVCCAAPDKLTSLPPFTGLGALQFSSSPLSHSLLVSTCCFSILCHRHLTNSKSGTTLFSQ